MVKMKQIGEEKILQKNKKEGFWKKKHDTIFLKKKKSNIKQKKNKWKHVKQKVKKRKKQQLHKDIIQELNSLWDISFSSLKSKRKKQERINKSLKIIGILKKIMLQNTISKSIQFIIKHSNDEQRLIIATNLKENFLILSKDKCGYHILLKLLAYGNIVIKVLVCEEILKHVKYVLTNRFGTLILDRILITPECKKFRLLLLQKIYSNLYVKFPAENNGIPLTLEQILEKAPEQKEFILQNMKAYLLIWLTKTPSLIFVQMILHKFLQHCNLNDYKEIINLAVPNASRLLTCKEGVFSVIEIFNFSNTKQRKKMIQQFRTYIQKMSLNYNSCLILLRALDVTDDTILTKKIIINECLLALDKLIINSSGRLPLIHVLCPRSRRYFNSEVLEYLVEPKTRENNIKYFQCKKNNEIRQRELLSFLIPKLAEWCKMKWNALLILNETVFLQIFLTCYRYNYNAVGTELLLSLIIHLLTQYTSYFKHNTIHRRLRVFCELCPEFCEFLINKLIIFHVQDIAKLRGIIILVRCLQCDKVSIKLKIKLRNALKNKKIINSNVKLLELIEKEIFV